MSSPQSVLRKSKLTLPSRVVLAGVIATIYILACCCPALRLDHYYPGSNTPQSSETWLGWTALVLGWLGILVGLSRLVSKLRSWLDLWFASIAAAFVAALVLFLGPGKGV